MGRQRFAGLGALIGAIMVMTACSGAEEADPDDPSPSPSTSSAAAPPTPTAEPAPWAQPDDARPAIAMRAVRYLANEIGPRPGHTAAYFEAADWVQEELEGHGWEVTRQRFPSPPGVSWGVPVEGGPSVNLIATRGDVVPGKPWLAIGAHLDTVPQAPGAEDNASGIGSLLAIAEATSDARTRLPLVLIAFGSEEPRGEGDNDHHFGSRAYVAELTQQQRRSLRGMVSMDRVGVGGVLPIKTVSEPSGMRDELTAAARRAGVETVFETNHSSSDHESFADEGMPGVRLGGAPYAGYHSPDDTPDAINLAQLERTICTVLAWVGRPA